MTKKQGTKRRKKAAVMVMLDMDGKEPQAYVQPSGQFTSTNTNAGDIVWYETKKQSIFRGLVTRLKSWFSGK